MEAVPDTGRTGFRYLLFSLFGRVTPAALFLFFCIVQAQLLLQEIQYSAGAGWTATAVGLIVNRVLSVAFAAAIALIYIVRRPPRQGAHGWLAFVVSMYASFVMLAVRPLAVALGVTTLAPPAWLLGLANLLVGIGVAFSVYALLYLKLNFSILPEARGLTQDGPYRIVRHPIYLGEIVTGLGLVLALTSVLSFALWLSFVAAQVIRIGYEERVLTAQFPQYADFARRRKRLIPWLL